MADKLHDIDVGNIVHIDKVSQPKELLAAYCDVALCCLQVLMVGSKIATLIGRPTVPGAEVTYSIH